MHLRLVGIDCATQDAKIGVAFGSFRNKTLTVLDAFACTKEKTAAIEISKWLQEGENPALLAFDAPLGWPQTLSRELATHRAGEELRADAHDMFRRSTDIFIKQKTGKTPLDVGADRMRALRTPRSVFSETFAPDLTLKGFRSRGNGRLVN